MTYIFDTTSMYFYICSITLEPFPNQPTPIDIDVDDDNDKKEQKRGASVDMYEATKLLGSFPRSIVDGKAINETWLHWLPAKEGPSKVGPEK
jgi:hypothetical protein